MIDRSSFASISNLKILVVGDVMLDRYWFGDVNRISPEAPVPICRISRTEDRLGGAANVARNIVSLGAAVSVLSVVGGDHTGRIVTELLKKEEIAADLEIDPKADTILKLRIIGHQQQLLRVDFETTPAEEILQQILRSFAGLIKDFDVVIFSDYGKGTLRFVDKMIEIARSHKKLVLVDPKGADWKKYRGATIITPNRGELQQVVGAWATEEELIRKVRALCVELDLTALLVTRSEEGMTLISHDEVISQATVAREVFDVSGAGDTVIGTLAVMLGMGFSWQDAIGISNRAAGIVVGKFGTSVTSLDEIFL